MATCVQPAATSQSSNSSSAAGVVANVRTAARAGPLASDTSRQACTSFWCTALPQQRGCSTTSGSCVSMAPPFLADGQRACLLRKILVYVLWAQPRVPSDTRVSLPYGLAAPRGPDLLGLQPSPPRAYRSGPWGRCTAPTAPFHGHGRPAGAWRSAMTLP